MTQEQKNYINTVLDMYCINLKRSSDRWECSVKEFEKYGIKVNRFDAIDGQQITYDELLGQNIVTNNLDHITKTQKGALGIIASSVKLWREISNKTTDKWCLIMEDDIKMHPNIIELFEQYWKEIPSDADIIFFGFQCLYGHDPYDDSILSAISDKISNNVVKLNKMVTGNHAYAINRKSANKLLTHFIPTSTPIDKFPPEKFNIYAFRRPQFPFTTKELVDDMYIDTAIWENNYPIIMHGLIGTRSEKSTIGHLKHNYMWFINNEIFKKNYVKALDYALLIKENLSIYDKETTNFKLWFKIIEITFNLNIVTDEESINELISRSETEEAKMGFINNKINLMTYIENDKRESAIKLLEILNNLSSESITETFNHAQKLRIKGNNELSFKLFKKIMETAIINIKNNNVTHDRKIVYFDLWDEFGTVTFYVNRKDLGRYAFKMIADLADSKTPETLEGLKHVGSRVLQNAKYYDCPDLCDRLAKIINNLQQSTIIYNDS